MRNRVPTETTGPAWDRGIGVSVRADGAGAVERDAAVVEVPVDVDDTRRQLLDGRRVGAEVALVEPDGPDVHRHRPALVTLTEHQLRRPSADVDDEHRPVGLDDRTF